MWTAGTNSELFFKEMVLILVNATYMFHCWFRFPSPRGVGQLCIRYGVIKLWENLKNSLKRAFVDAGKYDNAGAVCTDGSGTQVHYL